MYKLVDINDFVCLRKKVENDYVDEYYQVVGNKYQPIERVGAFVIKQISCNSEFGKKLISKKLGSSVELSNIPYKIVGIFDEKELINKTIAFLEDMGLFQEAAFYKDKLNKPKIKKKSK